MATYRVDELDGARLDFAVARIVHGDVETNRQFDFWLREVWEVGAQRFSTDWLLGGPLLKEHGICISPPEEPVHRNGGPNAGMGQSGVWVATSWKLRGPDGRRRAAWHDSEPLGAVMRLIVKCKLGEEIEL